MTTNSDGPNRRQPFHAGERELQAQFDSSRLADRIVEVSHRSRFTDDDRRFLAARDMFFLATSDDAGNLDCSYKGGDPGFVRVTDDETLVFPLYDGNGMFNSSGNILVHPKVGLLFIDWENGRRMRVNGTAHIDTGDPLLPEFPGAQMIVRVQPDVIYPNCPRYVHRMQVLERSEFVPRAGCEPPEPAWKDHFEDVLPADQRQRRAARGEGS